MRIGIISDSDALIPLVYTLAGQQSLQVYIYYSPSPDLFVNQKVYGFVKQARIPMTEERNKDRDLYPWLNKGKYDVCFVIGYKYRIRLERLVCQTPLFNIHFGSLPTFKGPTPVFWQLKYGAEKIGLCIHYLTEKLDSGDVVWLKEIENREHYNCKQVSQLFSQLCIEGVLLIIHFIMKGISLPVIDRGAFKNAYQKRPEMKDVKISWQQMNAVEICNLYEPVTRGIKEPLLFTKGRK